MAWWREQLAAGAALEAVAALAALEDSAAPALLAHAGACGAIAAALSRSLSGRVSASVNRSLSPSLSGSLSPSLSRSLSGRMTGSPSPGSPARLVFVTALLLPVLGVLGWIAVALVRPRHATHPLALVGTPVPGPEAARIHAEQPRSRGGEAPRTRVEAARRRDEPGAIALLRRALASADEDVRLVAHAILETRHRVAGRHAQDAELAVEAAPPERRAALHHRLAAAHWELARLGLAEGECLAHALDRAHHHACAAPDRASRALLLGRIELRRGNAAGAEAALARAVALGLPPEVAAPYLAEAAFLDRRFDRVRQRLAATAGGAAPARLRRFWS